MLAAAVAAGVLAGGLVGALAIVSSSTPAAEPRLTAPGALSGSCPSKAELLPADAVARAADEARTEARHLYPGDGSAVLTKSDLAPYAGPRGSEVKAQCGTRTFHRTEVVELLFPKELPSASLSQGVVFVSLSASGYRVWEVAH
jgi:hypothetical protein